MSFNFHGQFTIISCVLVPPLIIIPQIYYTNQNVTTVVGAFWELQTHIFFELSKHTVIDTRIIRTQFGVRFSYLFVTV